MPDERDIVLSLQDVEKDFRSLRPLRVKQLELREGEAMALLGFDQAAAEVLVNLIAGATLPDRGDVRIRGRSTAAIADGQTWMKALDDFGIVTERGVLLDQMTVEQNLAMPLTLDLYDLPVAIREQVAALADEVHLEREHLSRIASTLAPLDRLRLRLARGIAGDPRILLAEHPNASVPPDAVAAAAADFAEVAGRRRLSMLVITADPVFAAAVADQVLRLNPATGELTAVKTGWRRWFS